MFIPSKKAFYDLTPEEFEKYSLDLLSEQIIQIENATIVHNTVIKTHDGEYQIDGYIEFEVMGVVYKTIVECKHYKESISREKVAVLKDKISSIGANKGILIATSNFQSGALDYAKVHGIALIQLIESGHSYEVRGGLDVLVHSETPGLNFDKPYCGIFLEKKDDGYVSCAYLNKNNLILSKYIM